MSVETTKGVTVPCVKCASIEGTITLQLNDCDTFHCDQCDEDFTVEDVQGFLAACEDWGRILAWIESAPADKADA